MPSPYPYSVKKVSFTHFSSLDDVLMGLVNPSAEVRASAFQKLDSMPRDKMCQIVETAIHFPKKSVSDKTLNLLASKDRHRVVSLLRNMADSADEKAKGKIEYELKRLQDTRTLNDYLNEMGYELLKKGKVGKAIEVLETNVRLHPQSSNAYDSLGEAYLKAKKIGLATKFYEKSLKLNPDNSNASSMLRMIKKGIKKSKKS
jgi:tetratricopeptide (TPR) repeat protein